MLAPIIVAALFAAPADSSENSAVESFKLELGAQAYFTRLAGNFDDGTSTVSVEDIGLNDSTIAIDASFTVHDGKFHTSGDIHVVFGAVTGLRKQKKILFAACP